VLFANVSDTGEIDVASPGTAAVWNGALAGFYTVTFSSAISNCAPVVTIGFNTSSDEENVPSSATAVARQFADDPNSVLVVIHAPPPD
jgi:hypothetical protein